MVGHSDNGITSDHYDNTPSAEPATANHATTKSHSSDNKNMWSAKNDALSAQIATRGLKMLLVQKLQQGD
ncbi:hypothetical protein GBA52_023020 [Prunus armeniaca]|nr:hypothetical protein GBA52_023020 [Prunus armeniaca]